MNINLCDDPLIHEYPNFLTLEECDIIIKCSNLLLQDSTITGQKKGIKSSNRISKNCWLNHNHNSMIQNICERISSIVNYPLSHAEKMQVIYYPEGGKYDAHYDGWNYDGSEKTRRLMKYGGQRIMSVLCYLNTPIEGGETYFPKKKINVKAEKGKCLIFSNCYKDTIIKHDDSYHQSCEVKKGEKWVFTLMFRLLSLDELFNYPPPLLNNIKECLKKGDFLPLIEWKSSNNIKIKIKNIVDNKKIMFIGIYLFDLLSIPQELFDLYHIFVLSYISNKESSYMSHDELLFDYFNIPDNETNMNIYILNCERRVIYKEIHVINEFPDSCHLKNNIITPHIPYLLIENIFSDELLNEIINFYNNNESNLILHKSHSKNRTHIHPIYELEKKIDDALKKTVYYKMIECFNFYTEYRELYKICCYDSSNNGRFHAHRDSVEPYEHRAFGMSIALNDDYEGGEFKFIEYEKEFKLKKNSALVFPAIYSHQVCPIKKGKRFTLISFLIHQQCGELKKNNDYKIK